MNLLIELLDKSKHDIKNFDCSQKEMNAFLKQFAVKNQNLKISKSWAVFAEQNLTDKKKAEIIGYFTLTAQTIEPELLEELEKDKFPKYPLPITLLARLAVDVKFQNQGFGEKILFLALRKAAELCNSGLATYGVVLDVLDDRALKFYQKFEFFKKLDVLGKRLYVSMNAIEDLFK